MWNPLCYLGHSVPYRLKKYTHTHTHTHTHTASMLVCSLIRFFPVSLMQSIFCVGSTVLICLAVWHKSTISQTFGFLVTFGFNYAALSYSIIYNYVTENIWAQGKYVDTWMLYPCFLNMPLQSQRRHSAVMTACNQLAFYRETETFLFGSTSYTFLVYQWKLPVLTLLL